MDTLCEIFDVWELFSEEEKKRFIEDFCLTLSEETLAMISSHLVEGEKLLK